MRKNNISNGNIPKRNKLIKKAFPLLTLVIKSRFLFLSIL